MMKCFRSCTAHGLDWQGLSHYIRNQNPHHDFLSQKQEPHETKKIPSINDHSARGDGQTQRQNV
jgi:hypothetical protein